MSSKQGFFKTGIKVYFVKLHIPIMGIYTRIGIEENIYKDTKLKSNVKFDYKNLLVCTKRENCPFYNCSNQKT